jgi:hypothetical protein
MQGEHRLALVTDDSRVTELYETVRLARQDGSVTVFLLPDALFPQEGRGQQSGLERYRSFESLRGNLERIPNVSVYEFGPGDRLNAMHTSPPGAPAETRVRVASERDRTNNGPQELGPSQDSSR